MHIQTHSGLLGRGTQSQIAADRGWPGDGDSTGTPRYPWGGWHAGAGGTLTWGIFMHGGPVLLRGDSQDDPPAVSLQGRL